MREAARLSPACQRYYEALKLCDANAFAEAAASLLHYLGSKKRIWSKFGDEFERAFPKCLYVNSTLEELRDRNIPTTNLDRCHHWPMIDRLEKSILFLSSFLEAE